MCGACWRQFVYEALYKLRQHGRGLALAAIASTLNTSDPDASWYA